MTAGVTPPALARRAYLHPADGHLHRRLGPALVERGFEILGGYAGSSPPAFLSASYQIGSSTAVATSRQFLAIADVVIYELHGNEAAARNAVVHMARQPFGGRQQLFMGVSTPLVWAAARPAPPEEDADVPDSASAVGDPKPVAEEVPGDAYAVAAAAGALTDRDAGRRAPCLSVLGVYELEQVITRAQRKGKLRTAVVCPGWLYGRGEADTLLHPIMRTAWELGEPLRIYGSGTNFLPMMHVDDCAAYLATLAGLPLLGGMPDSQQYLLAADCASPGVPGGVQQAALVQALAERLGHGETTTVPAHELLFMTGTERWTLNTPLAMTPLPAPAAATCQLRYSQGILNHLDEVIQQWKDARGVTPLRVVMAGPPMAGKSALAARLAHLYRLPLFTARDLLAAADKLSPDDARALSAELSGKEPRASARSMAALLRGVLGSHRAAANRGFVLDAFPKTAGQAGWAFMTLAAMSAEEMAEKEKDEAASRTVTPLGAKGGKPAPSTPPGKKDPKKEVKSDGPEVPAGQKLVPDAQFAPTHLIQVDAPHNVLAARLSVVERQEVEAVRAASGQETGKPAGKGGAKDKIVVPGSHNNDKDFTRRMAAWTQLRAEEAADLETQQAVARARWERKQADITAERERAEAEARTLRARRRREREEAAAAAAATATAAAATVASSAALPPSAKLANSTVGGLEGSDPALTVAAVAAPAATEVGPALPQYGGLAGVLVGACGARILELTNLDKPGGPPITPDSWTAVPPNKAASQQGGKAVGPTLQALEQTLKAFLGPAHNFEGFPDTRPPPVGPVGSQPRFSEPGLVAAVRRSLAGALTPSLDDAPSVAQQEAQESARQAGLSLLAKHADVAEPVRRYVMAQIMPTVTEALRDMCADRPTDPVRLLATHLLQAADKLEAAYVDPYIDPAYEVQRTKVREKQERDAARELAAQQKAAKELAVKQAAKVAAAQEAQQQHDVVAAT